MAAGIVVGAFLAFAVGTAKADPDKPTRPPGNNGTVKIDARPFDEHPDNQPHVGCEFQVDFYGYDAGELSATYAFVHWPPTGSGEVLIDGSVPIGEDEAGGGVDLDASVTVDLRAALMASGASPHPQQGFHVRLDVHADGSIGADVKHKVFWIRGCLDAVDEPSPPPSPEPSPTEMTPSPTETGSVAPSPTAGSPTVAPTTVTSTPTGSPTGSTSPDAVGGRRRGNPPSPSVLNDVVSNEADGDLAFTGDASLLPLIALALGLLIVGTAALRLGGGRRAR